MLELAEADHTKEVLDFYLSFSEENMKLEDAINWI
jgi:hypothetical protein